MVVLILGYALFKECAIWVKLKYISLILLHTNLGIYTIHGRRKVYERMLCIWAAQRLSQGRMANFPAFIASIFFDLCNHHIPQLK